MQDIAQRQIFHTVLDLTATTKGKQYMTSREDARAKAGDTIKILDFAETMYESEKKLLGKTGVVDAIFDDGSLAGTWGSLHILPEDEYAVIKE